MTISSISEYLDTISTLATSAAQSGASQTATGTVSGNEDCDSYVSTIPDSSEAIPCDTYNDILSVMSKSVTSESSQETLLSENTETTGSQALGGAGGGGSDSEEDETTTSIVTINGVTYLETTTTSNGITTTTRTAISGTESVKPAADSEEE